MTELVECIACLHGDHANHRKVVQAVAPGVLGGARCPCKGECETRSPVDPALKERAAEQRAFDAAFPGLPEGMELAEAFRRIQAALAALTPDDLKALLQARSDEVVVSFERQAAVAAEQSVRYRADEIVSLITSMKPEIRAKYQPTADRLKAAADALSTALESE